MSSEFNRMKEVIASSLRADIAHAARMVNEGNGDKGYWEREIEKAQVRLTELGKGQFDVASYVLDMVSI